MRRALAGINRPQCIRSITTSRATSAFGGRRFATTTTSVRARTLTSSPSTSSGIFQGAHRCQSASSGVRAPGHQLRTYAVRSSEFASSNAGDNGTPLPNGRLKTLCDELRGIRAAAKASKAQGGEGLHPDIVRLLVDFEVRLHVSLLATHRAKKRPHPKACLCRR